MTKQKYITTAIPYVNDKPHIGHAIDYLLADVWARYEKQQGSVVRYSAGTDEHGTKIAEKASEKGIDPQEFVDGLYETFTDMQKKLNVSVTDFVRTSDPDHMRRVSEIWKKLDAADMIYKDKYSGWYCSGCEGFLTETEAKSVNYECLDHKKPLEKLEEVNYYLRVSKYTDEIREFAMNHVVPKWRGKEILELVKDGAQDVSISRPTEKLTWGVPVPGDDTQVMYVWVDALSNYVTVLGYPDVDISDFWPADVEVVGKDILRFHAVIWPAMLLALGLELPETLLAHGFVNADGTKMSKSLGNVVDPILLIDKYGTDAFRYFFLRHIPTYEDGDYTDEKFISAYNGELANDLGNLVARTANMVKRFVDGSTVVSSEFSYDLSACDKYLADFRYDLALEEIWKLIQSLNKYIDDKKPWEIAKDESRKDELAETMSHLVAGLQLIGERLWPFLPDTAEKITKIFSGETIGDAPILFPRIEKE